MWVMRGLEVTCHIAGQKNTAKILQEKKEIRTCQFLCLLKSELYFYEWVNIR